MNYDINTVIRVAEQELNYLEKATNSQLDSKFGNAGSANYTKYWRDVCTANQGQPWCDCFVSWCFQRAYGAETANNMLCCGLTSYYTPTSAGLYEKAGRFSKTPMVGDQIFFKNSKRICHTGIVVAVTATTVTTIEGNTSSMAGVIPNGGGVCKKTYQRNYSGISGYGHPVYTTAGTSQFPKWVKSGDDWYYRIADGKNAHGWMTINHHKYYFDKSGKMVKEWNEIDGKWYYFQPESGKGEALAGALYVSDANGAQQILTI